MDAASRIHPRFRLAVFALVSFAIGAMLAVAFAFQSPSAYAVTDNTDAVADDMQQRVEDATSAYREASDELEELAEKIAQNAVRIEQIRADLPAQRARSAEALVSLYKFDQEGFSLMNLVFNSGDLRGFIQGMEYLTHILDKYSADAAAAAKMEAELVERQAELQKAEAEAKERFADADAALAAAEQARFEAIAAARAQIAAETAAVEREGSATEQPAVSGPSDDGVTGNEDRDSFIATWAPRIDAYLAGSPLGGTGAVFAGAAWDYGVDPRFSPAISCVESSKGAACFLPHNAWGWGSCSWSSWEEAICDHVAGLARGYGYTVSVAGAQRYCPPNWEFWYNSVSAQMNLI